MWQEISLCKLLIVEVKTNSRTIVESLCVFTQMRTCSPNSSKDSKENFKECLPQYVFYEE